VSEAGCLLERRIPIGNTNWRTEGQFRDGTLWTLWLICEL